MFLVRVKVTQSGMVRVSEADSSSSGLVFSSAGESAVTRASGSLCRADG